MSGGSASAMAGLAGGAAAEGEEGGPKASAPAMAGSTGEATGGGEEGKSGRPGPAGELELSWSGGPALPQGCPGAEGPTAAAKGAAVRRERMRSIPERRPWRGERGHRRREAARSGRRKEREEGARGGARARSEGVEEAGAGGDSGEVGAGLNGGAGRGAAGARAPAAWGAPEERGPSGKA